MLVQCTMITDHGFLYFVQKLCTSDIIAILFDVFQYEMQVACIQAECMNSVAGSQRSNITRGQTRNAESQHAICAH